MSSAISMPSSRACRTRLLKSSNVPSSGRMSLCPPQRTRWPKASHIAGIGRERIVGSLAVAPSDRMDGREVQHIESHARHVRQSRYHVTEGAVPPPAGRGGSRKTIHTSC